MKDVLVVGQGKADLSLLAMTLSLAQSRPTPLIIPFTRTEVEPDPTPLARILQPRPIGPIRACKVCGKNCPPRKYCCSAEHHKQWMTSTSQS